MSLYNFTTLLGGLAMFLYGMLLLSNGLEKLSGGRLERILESMTDNIFKGVFLGAAVTIMIQSSSATTVIVVGLVSAGILKLRPAIGVIMGANIGTTVTAHILRLTDIESTNFFVQLLKPAAWAPLIAMAGVVMLFASKRSFHKSIATMLIGFGILFTGMMQMEAAVIPLRDLPQFSEMFAKFTNPILGVLVGAGVTAIIQSSAASIGILQALSSTGVITFAAAFPIIMGQNIGTCITPVLASIGASKNAKRSAVIHLSFNIIGTVVFLVGIYAFQYAVGLSFWNSPVDKGGIANFHSVFNIAVTILLLPFAGLLEKLAMFVIKDKDNGEEKGATRLLDERLLISPGLAVDHSRTAVLEMARLAKENFNLAVQVLHKFDAKTAEIIEENENALDKMEDKLGAYLLRISQKELTDKESRDVSELLHVMNEFEHIGDRACSITKAAENLYESRAKFSDKAWNEVDTMVAAVDELLQLGIDAYTNRDLKKAAKVEPLEEVIDLMEEKLKARHFARLKKGKCSLEAAFPFVETISNLERISDNVSNIGVYIIGQETTGGQRDFDSHDYLRTLHKGEKEDYADQFKVYEVKYYNQI